MEDVPVKDFSPGSGDGWITDQGYRAFEICGVRLYEHRVVMAGMVGRELLPTETVHHINGDRSDNRSENLQLRQGNHGKGIVMACGDCGSHNVVPVPLQ